MEIIFVRPGFSWFVCLHLKTMELNGTSFVGALSTEKEKKKKRPKKRHLKNSIAACFSRDIVKAYLENTPNTMFLFSGDCFFSGE